MADRLAALMAHFPITARVFNAGALCGINALDSDGVHGQLHLVRKGVVEVHYGTSTLSIAGPGLLLFALAWRWPRPRMRRRKGSPKTATASS